ncbi:hypothetical protein Q1695_015880 [Nippostrongylus brasiliensis]|nr:hypothetical protein Q1695_015880 [Nippostrongylus brasiliensis]
MIVTKALLLLLFTASTAYAQQKKAECGPLPHNDDYRQDMIDMFKEYHEGLNLTWDCDAMKEASRAAGAMMIGNPTHIDHHWCLYSRQFFDLFGVVDVFTESPLYRMPKDKITQTAKLHPGTKYGCAFRKTVGFFGPYFATVCIYKRIASETRCFCN